MAELLVVTVPRDPEIAHKFVKLQTGRHFWNLSYLLERGRVIVFMVQRGGVIVFVVEYGGMTIFVRAWWNDCNYFIKEKGY